MEAIPAPVKVTVGHAAMADLGGIALAETAPVEVKDPAVVVAHLPHNPEVEEEDNEIAVQKEA